MRRLARRFGLILREEGRGQNSNGQWINLGDFLLPFSISVVTSSSEAGLNASRGEETIHGCALSTLAEGRWIWLRIELILTAK